MTDGRAALLAASIHGADASLVCIRPELACAPHPIGWGLDRVRVG